MSTDERHSYKIRDGHCLRHDPLPAILGPRPIGWISTCDVAADAELTQLPKIR